MEALTKFTQKMQMLKNIAAALSLLLLVTAMPVAYSQGENQNKVACTETMYIVVKRPVKQPAYAQALNPLIVRLCFAS